MSRLSGKSVLVTGGTSGIGVCIAQRCSEEGATVYVAGRNRQRGEEVVSGLPNRGYFVSLDVTNERSWEESASSVINTSGHWDVLINNAGIMSPADVESTSIDFFNSIMSTNAGGVFLGCRTAVRIMKKSSAPCSIVNVLSTTARKTSAWTMAYGASKSAALSITKSVALYCAEQKLNIRCNALLPGVVMTPMVEDLLESSPDPEGMLSGLIASHPIGRLVESIEVANGAVYFASDESTGITGAEFAIDGGLTAS